MSLDVNLLLMQPVTVYRANITHNLGEMANQVIVVENQSESDNISLYDVLWRPEAHGYTHAHDIVDYLHMGYKELVSNPIKYQRFNPQNGWGNYEQLVEFVKQYYIACMDNLDAELSLSK